MEERKEKTETEEGNQKTHTVERKEVRGTEERREDEETDSDRILNHIEILEKFLQSAFESTPKQERNFGASSSSKPSPEGIVPPGSRQINDHVYELTNLSGRRPSIELVFFHGLQLQKTHQPHLDTWLSADGTELWLNWIIQKFPDARILTVKYDAHPMRTDENGRMDMYVLTENLLQCLIKAAPFGAEVGQVGCPVVCVGHCVGGLVMKQLCVYANSKVTSSERFGKAVRKFLKNVKGLFFYGTPHYGTELADLSTGFSKGQLFKDLTIHNEKAARQNEEFRELRKKSDWKTFGIVESQKTILGEFRGVIVPEASARYDVDEFYTAEANHFDVCRPSSSESSTTFTTLSDFITDRIEEGEAPCNPEIPIPDAVVGLDKQVALVRNQLKKCTRLGIVGMGGIGKTTLAKTVYNTISGNYDYACFVEGAKLDMKEEENPDELRRKILARLFEREDKVDDKFKWRKLKGKRVLIVLDDVVSTAQVRVMTNEDGFSNESHLIVTSRDQEFLRHEFEFFHVAPLNDTYSRQLLCINAFKKEDAPPEYKNCVESLTEKCAGFPLGLKIVGKYLYKRPKVFWEDALVRLSKAIALNNKDDKLWSVVRMGYEGLEEHAQEMFQDIATIFHGEKLSTVKDMWKTGWTYDEITWATLVEKGFVTEGYRIRGEGEASIQMHEVLRDLGRSVADGSRVHHRISPGNIPTWPVESQGKSPVKFLRISFEGFKWSSLGNDPRLQPVGFNEIRLLRNLGELRFLWIQGGSLYGSCHLFPQELVYAKIEEVNSWDESTSGDIFSQGSEPHRQLRYLEITGGFHLKSIPRSLGQLRALKHLSIYGSSLHDLPEELGQLAALEHLAVGGYSFMLNVPVTLANLRKLKYLSIEGFRNARNPDWDYVVGRLEALEHLSLSVDAFPKSVVNLRRLKVLKIRGIEDDALPNNLGKLRTLVKLDIVWCHNLQVLPDSVCELAALEDLEISQCNKFKSIPPTLGHLTALKRLAVYRCPVNAVPESLWDIEDLEDLTLSTVEALPDTLEKLQALKYLGLRYCEFESVPDTIGKLKALMVLELAYCPNMKALPDTIGQLKGLKHLQIIQCPLKALPGSIGDLHALERVELAGCYFLEALPDSLGSLHALKSLKIEGCDELNALPLALGRLRSLEHLEIIMCHSLTALPDSLGQLLCLKRLRVHYCKGLRELPVSLQEIRENFVDLEEDFDEDSRNVCYSGDEKTLVFRVDGKSGSSSTDGESWYCSEDGEAGYSSEDGE